MKRDTPESFSVGVMCTRCGAETRRIWLRFVMLAEVFIRGWASPCLPCAAASARILTRAQHKREWLDLLTEEGGDGD